MIPNPDATAPASEPDLDAAFLHEFLADHDERCPVCGYNLRGCPSTAWPCGCLAGRRYRRWLMPDAAQCRIAVIAVGLLIASIAMSIVAIVWF